MGPGESIFLKRADEILRRIGYDLRAPGPYVEALRDYTARKCSEGMGYMSGGTWAPGSETLSQEERARHTLAFLWSADNEAYPIECIDGPPWGRWWDFKAGRMRRRIHWRRFPAWMRDQFRRVYHKPRIWLRRNVFGIKNPYVPRQSLSRPDADSNQPKK